MMAAKDKHIIIILLKIAKFCGICPLEKRTRFSVFYQIFILCVTLSLTVISTYLYLGENYHTMSSLRALLNIFTLTFLTIEGIAIQITSLLYPKTWKRLYKELDLNRNGISPKTKIYFELFVIHFLFFGRIVWNLSVWVAISGWKMNSLFIYRIIYEYNAIISVTLMVHINNIIRKRLRCTYGILLKAEKNYQYGIRVLQVEIDYRKLLRVLDDFNCIFGYQILFLMGHTIIILLSVLHVTLIYSSNDLNNILILSWTTNTVIFILV